MSDSFAVVRDHPSLIAYIDALQRKNAESLSFYPRIVFEREAQQGRLFLGLLNGEPCGYIYCGSGQHGNLRCHQVCIQYDARRRLYGAALVVAMEDYATKLSCTRITLRCGFDLEANHFWRSLGYGCVQTVDGGVRRMRRINVWVKLIGPELFEPEFVDAAIGKTSAATWAKHKQTGIVSQFVRGRRMNQYRALVLNGDVTKDE